MTVIANGRHPDILLGLRKAKLLGSLLVPDLKPLAARKRWLASHSKTRGAIIIDAAAVEAIKKQGRSLLPVGVDSIRGSFERGDMVMIESMGGEHIATGLTNYGSAAVGQMRGKTTTELKVIKLLLESTALVHRDNMALIQSGDSMA